MSPDYLNEVTRRIQMADAAATLFFIAALTAGVVFAVLCIRWNIMDMAGRYLSQRKEKKRRRPGQIFLIAVMTLACALSCVANVKAYDEGDSLPEDLVLSVSWQGVERIVEVPLSASMVNREEDMDLSDIGGTENEVFMKENGGMQVSLTGTEPDPEGLQVRIFFRKAWDEAAWQEVTERSDLVDLNWNIPRENRLACYFRFMEEGHYKVEISYTEESGRGFTADSQGGCAACVEGELYKSPVISCDAEPPELSCALLPEPEETSGTGSGKKGYYKEKPIWKIRVREENFHADLFHIRDEVTDADGRILDIAGNPMSDRIDWESFYEKGERWNEARIIIDEEGNHHLSIMVEDGSGNQSDFVSEKVTFDKKPPLIVFEKDDGEYGTTVLCDSDPVHFYPYRDYSYFTKGEMKIRIRAEDRISGVRSIRYALSGHDIENPKELNPKELKEKTAGKTQAAFTFTIPGGKDVRTCLYVLAEDACGNISPLCSGKGMISESDKVHQDHSQVKLKLPDPVRKDEDKGILYYNSDICVEGSFEDGFSGIHMIGIRAGKDRDAWEKKSEKTEKTNGDIVKKDSLKMYLNASEWEESCGQKPIVVKAFMEDNAGNKDDIPCSGKIVIDRIRPSITVSYDGQEAKNGHYYNSGRDAVVMIHDMNPDMESLKWNIKGNPEGYRIGSYEKVKDGYRCRISFFGDGENYRVGLALSDFAGNRASFEESESFTIDSTPPVITMQMDRSDAHNGKYFNKEKSLTVVIRDRNVPADHIKWKRFCRNKEGGGKAPELVLMTSVKGTAVYRLNLKEDASYRLDVSCTDLAGNRSETVSSGEIVIDKKPPALSVTGVERGGIYTDRICPAVCIRDEYLDQASLHAVLTDGSGADVSRKICAPVQRASDTFVRVSWEGFPIKESCDGIYEIHVAGKDLAGNTCRIRRPVRFTVDRFGASYLPDKRCTSFLKSYYHCKGQDLNITETSPAPLQTEVVLIRDNESRIPLREGEDYTRTPGMIKEGSKKGWVKNTYSLPAGIFRTEGAYRILLVSRVNGSDEGKRMKDQVMLQTDNEEKDLNLQFVIDKTPPAVTFCGLDQDEYREKVHRAGVAVLDNFELDYLEITVTEGLFKKHSKRMRIGPGDLDRKNMYYFDLPEGRSVKRITYEARDRAGNVIRSDDRGDACSVLVTTNLLVRLMNQKLLAFLACCIPVLLSAAAVRIAGGKRKV